MHYNSYFENYLKFGLLAFLLTLVLTTFAFSENLVKSHGISNFGDLKYPADYKSLAYVNPTAPKGGEISIAFCNC